VSDPISLKPYISTQATELFLEFPTIDQAIEEIFSQATEKEKSQYKKQLLQAKDGDPALIILPEVAWINQYGTMAYNQVMDLFATINLTPPNRRDEQSRAIFHYNTSKELYLVRDTIRNQAPNAFQDAPSTINQLTNPQVHPVGDAWVLLKIGTRSSDYAKDTAFFRR
jgi:hypothetical protein